MGHEAEPGEADDDEEEEGAPCQVRQQRDRQQALGQIEDGADNVANLRAVSQRISKPSGAGRRDDQRKTHEGQHNGAQRNELKITKSLWLPPYAHVLMSSRQSLIQTLR